MGLYFRDIKKLGEVSEKDVSAKEGKACEEVRLSFQVKD